VYVFVCYMYLCVYMYVCISVYLCISVCVYLVYVCIYVSLCVYMNVYIFVYLCISDEHLGTYLNFNPRHETNPLPHASPSPA